MPAPLGSKILNVTLSGSLVDSAQILPPWLATMRLQMASPRPMPRDLPRVKNIPKTSAVFSSGMWEPVLLIVMSSWLPSAGQTVTVNLSSGPMASKNFLLWATMMSVIPATRRKPKQRGPFTQNQGLKFWALRLHWKFTEKRCDCIICHTRRPRPRRVTRQSPSISSIVPRMMACGSCTDMFMKSGE